MTSRTNQGSWADGATRRPPAPTASIGPASPSAAVPVAPVGADQQPPSVDARVLLAGAFGQGNPGDEALLTAFARALPGAEIVATSSAPAKTAAAHGVGAVPRHDIRAMLRALRAADAVVFAGGTIFKRLHPSSGRPPLALLSRAAALAAATKAQRKLLAIVGVGVGALDGAAAPRLARAIVRACDLLVLRDDESATSLAAAGAPTPMRVGADAAWTLPLAPSTRSASPHPPPPGGVALPGPPPHPPSPGVVAPPGPPPHPPPPGVVAPPGPARERGECAGAAVVVALSHFAGGRDLADRLAAALAPLRRAGVPIELQPWQRAGDDELARVVRQRLGDGATLLAPPADLAAATAGLAGARLVLGLRFHSLVAAAAAGVPFVAFVHEPKLAAVARRLDQPAVAATAPPQEVATALIAALDGPPAPPAAVQRERALALDAFRLLRVLLARGRSEEAHAVDGLALRPEEWL